jgi:hypothetical protein
MSDDLKPCSLCHRKAYKVYFRPNSASCLNPKCPMRKEILSITVWNELSRRIAKVEGSNE